MRKWLRSCFLAGALTVFLAVTAVTIKPTLLELILVADVPLDRADALVLMAGGGRQLRLAALVDLYDKGVSPRILLTNDGIFSAWSNKYQRNLYLVEWAREHLLEQGVPDDAIVMLDYIESGSYFDALNTRNFVLADGSIDSLLVVTSAYHTRRTLWTFRQVFADTDVIVGVYPAPKDPDYTGRYLKTYTMESVKLVYYWLRYGLMGEWGVGSGEWGRQKTAYRI